MKKVFLILFLFALSAFAQEDEIRIENFVITNQINQQDMFDSNLGRFDVYELDLNVGDTVNLELTAEAFIPMLILMAPSQEYFLEMPQNNSSEVSLSAKIDESGKWFLYVVGDSTDEGTYSVKTYFASSKALVINPDDSFCDKLNFYIEHSFADFHFLEDKNIYSFAEAEGKVILDSDNNLKFTFYQDKDYGKAMNIFDDVAEKVRDCLGAELSTLNPNSENLMWEKIKGKYISEVNLNVEENEETNNYTVVLTISKKVDK